MNEERDRPPATISRVLQLDATWVDYNAVIMANSELGNRDHHQKTDLWFVHVMHPGSMRRTVARQRIFEAESAFERQRIFLHAYKRLMEEIRNDVCRHGISSSADDARR